jgi:hypothetical protein
MYLSSMAMTRLNFSPAPLSQVSVTGFVAVSVVESALHTVWRLGVFTLGASVTKPVSAQ